MADKKSHADVMADVRGMTPDQLQDEIVKLKREAFNLRFQQATSQLEKTHRVREVRREIARVKTVLAQKARAEAEKEASDA